MKKIIKLFVENQNVIFLARGVTVNEVLINLNYSIVERAVKINLFTGTVPKV